jgi:hypothetical protein
LLIWVFNRSLTKKLSVSLVRFRAPLQPCQIEIARHCRITGNVLKIFLAKSVSNAVEQLAPLPLRQMSSRDAPHSPSLIPLTEMLVANPSGYIAVTSGRP